MTQTETRDRTVLIADDEPGIRDLIVTWLEGEYEVREAADGPEALERVDEDVDIALLDRRMPVMSGDELLEELRDRGYEFPIGMVTAVTPNVDIVEMPFDDYVEKPIAKDELVRMVDLLAKRADYDEHSRRFFRLASKRGRLRASENVDHHTSPEYQEVTAEMESLREHLDDVLMELSEDDLERAYHQL